MEINISEQVDFGKVVAEHYSELTKNEKRIADFMSQNQDEAAFMPAAEIARSLKSERTHHWPLCPNARI